MYLAINIKQNIFLETSRILRNPLEKEYANKDYLLPWRS